MTPLGWDDVVAAAIALVCAALLLMRGATVVGCGILVALAVAMLLRAWRLGS